MISSLIPSWKSFFGLPIITISSVIGLLWISQSTIIYPSRSYEKYGLGKYYINLQYTFEKNGNKLREFKHKNDLGQDLKFFYVEPTILTSRNHHNQQQQIIWVMTGGNAMLALDWLPFITKLRQALPSRFSRDAFVLIEYPGYGINSNGNPSSITSNNNIPGRTTMIPHVIQSIEEIKNTLYSADGEKNVIVNLVAHSLGCAVGLEAAVAAQEILAMNQPQNNNNNILFERMILVSPFTSIAAMAATLFIPSKSLRENILGDHVLENVIFENNRWNNIESVSHFIKNVTMNNKVVGNMKQHPYFFVIHGTRDEIVPYEQGVQLYQHIMSLSNQARFVTIEGGDHNTIFDSAFQEIMGAMILPLNTIVMNNNNNKL
jgi:pimeloyl-ACP methyl ester carboxylesterase